jgi:hypothetical protein
MEQSKRLPVTDRRIELDEATKIILDEKLRIVQEQLSRNSA